MKRSRLLRYSEDPVSGEGTMRGVTKKRHRKQADDKPSNKDKRSEEKKKRSKKKKKRIEEETADEVMMGQTTAGEGGMTQLSQELLDYLRTKEVMGLLATEAPLLPWANKMGAALFDDQSLDDLKQQIAAEFHENREFDAHVLYQYRTYGSGYAYAEKNIIKDDDDTAAETTTEEDDKNKKKKQLVTLEMNHADMLRPYLSDEVRNYVMCSRIVTFGDCVTSIIESDYFSSVDPSTEGEMLDFYQRQIENQASLLRQYRTTNGRHVVLQFELNANDERDHL